MAVRKLDENHDWMFGQSRQNYIDKSDEVAQQVQCRLWSFADDWFLNREHGVPWFVFLGNRLNSIELEQEIKRTVLETNGVKTLDSYQLDFNNRVATITVSFTDDFGKSTTKKYEINSE